MTGKYNNIIDVAYDRAFNRYMEDENHRQWWNGFDAATKEDIRLYTIDMVNMICDIPEFRETLKGKKRQEINENNERKAVLRWLD